MQGPTGTCELEPQGWLQFLQFCAQVLSLSALFVNDFIPPVSCHQMGLSFLC